MKNKEILEKTLNQMDIVFSSNEFSEKAKKNGINQFQINNGIIADFLHKNAIQGDTKRMWEKINFNNYQKSDEIMTAINLLKSNGYKILKPVSDWIEI